MTRNVVSVIRALGVNPSTEREVDDFYATDPRAIKHLLYFEKFDKNIWECCVGQGHLANELKKYGYKVRGTDLIDRGYENCEIMDFLQIDDEKWNGDIITNPPYKNANDVIRKALEIVTTGNKVAMFLKIQFLESVARYDLFKEYPPKKIYVYSDRIGCYRGGDFTYKTHGAVCYAWYVWEKGYDGNTIIDWIMSRVIDKIDDEELIGNRKI